MLVREKLFALCARRTSKTRPARAQLLFRDRVAWIAGYPERSRSGASSLEFRCVPARGTATTHAATPENVGATLRAYREIVRDEDGSMDDIARAPERIEPILAATPWNLFSPRTIELARDVAQALGTELCDALAWTFASEGLEREALTWASGVRDDVLLLRESLRAWKGNEARAVPTVKLARIAIGGVDKRAAEYLHLLATSGHLDVRTNAGKDAPPAGNALFALLDACSNATRTTGGARSASPSRPIHFRGSSQPSGTPFERAIRRHRGTSFRHARARTRRARPEARARPRRRDLSTFVDR